VARCAPARPARVLVPARRRGHRPQDIEQTVDRCHPDLRPGCCAAFAVEQGGEERLVVVQEVTKDALGRDLEPALRAIRKSVAEEHEPPLHAITLLPPGGTLKTSSGKIQRRHLSTEHLRRELAAVRARDTFNGILVVTEGLFSMDSDSPFIAAWQAASDEFDATLLIDVAHDFGAMGPQGTSQIGHQKMLGKVDLVMGSFSKTFASNGGFVASHRASVKQYLKFYGGPQTF
jgi:hypothetical protein